MGRFTYSSHVLMIFGNRQWPKLLGQPTKCFSHELARPRLTIIARRTMQLRLLLQRCFEILVHCQAGNSAK